MAGENTQKQETEITPTPTNSIGSQASTEDLEQLQSQMFGQKKEAKKSEPAKKEEPEPTPAPKKDVAADLFKKTTESDQTLTDEQKNAQEGEDDDSEFDAAGTFIDVSKFMEDGEPKTKEKEVKSKSEPDVDLDKESNIKNLRQVAGGFKKERDEAQNQITELQTELKNRPDTNGLQSKVSTLEARVKELEPYELVFGLHNNPQFKEKYIQGSESLVNEMTAIARDYGVDESVVQELVISTNRKEIDDLLSDALSSAEARSDLKSLKQRYDGLQREKREFEKTPEEAFRKFEESKVDAAADRNKRRDARFQETVNSAWSAALSANQEVQQNQRINELIEIAGQKEHNERVARPTLKAANDLYSAGIKHIERMIRNEAVIDTKFAAWFASIAQQASATQMLNFSRSAIHEKLQETLRTQEEEHSRNRPGTVTPSRSKPVSTGDGEKLSGKQRAAQIFSEVQEEFPVS